MREKNLELNIAKEFYYLGYVLQKKTEGKRHI